MAQISFEQFLTDNSDIVNEYLSGWFSGPEQADIQRYLYEPLESFSSNAGKRHRPLICMLACKALGGEFIDALIPACAIENFHTAALLHDDIADRSSLRRGEPCMYITEGLGLAINAGDMALSSVVSCVLSDGKLSDSAKIKVLEELVIMDDMTIEGQALDIGWARDHRFDISIDEYLLMATRKTAYYSGGTPLAVGAIVAGATDEQIEAMREYGISTGLAFQIQDDLLNLIGDESVVGKDRYGDIVEGKRTYAAVYAITHSKDAEELIEIIDKPENTQAECERAVEIMLECGAIDNARSYAVELVDKAKAELEGAIPNSESKDLLLDMADYFINRML